MLVRCWVYYRQHFRADWLGFAKPFAIVIVGGLFAALFISIYLLPTMYVWVARDTDMLPLSDTEWEERPEKLDSMQ